MTPQGCSVLTAEHDLVGPEVRKLPVPLFPNDTPTRQNGPADARIPETRVSRGASERGQSICRYAAVVRPTVRGVPAIRALGASRLAMI